MFDVILAGKHPSQPNTLIVITKDKKELFTIEDLLSSKFSNLKNTIILYDFNEKDLDFPGVSSLFNNVNYVKNEDYNKTIYIPSFVLFNGLDIVNLIGLKNFHLNNNEDSNFKLLIKDIEEFISLIDGNLLEYIIRYKKTQGFLSFPDNKQEDTINGILGKQLEKRKIFSKKSNSNNINFILDMTKLNEFLLLNSFIQPYLSISPENYKNIEINKDNLKDSKNKKLLTLTTFYDGILVVDNFEIKNEFMNSLNFPNIFKRLEEKVYVPFSLFKFLYNYIIEVKIEEVILFDRDYIYKDYIKKKAENKTINFFLSLLNFRLNYDTFSNLNKNQLQGYVETFLFYNLSTQEDDELIFISFFYSKYCKGKLEVSVKEIFEDFNKSMRDINLIALN